MLYEEFARLPVTRQKPSAKEFEVIDLVYNYHPCITADRGKDQIAGLYSEYGMRIIYDMQETAKRVKEIICRREEFEHELADIEREYRELTMR